jgi:hypothetical protein
MRLSADPNDPAYAPLTGGIRVFLDGIERCNVVTADEEKRLVVVHPLDERGNLILNRERDEVVTETLHGHVRIELTDSTRQTLQLLGVLE